MGIDQRFVDIIEQCEARLDELNDWERKFILGDEKKGGGPLKNRGYLSYKQQEILERIECEKLLGKKWSRRGVQLQYGAINASQSNAGWIVTVANYPVGEGVTKKEAGIITHWLHRALAGILSVPPSDLSDYQDGTPAEIPEREEVPTEDNMKDDDNIPF